jgi:hypothetical protein
VVFHFPLLQHCKLESVSSKHTKLRRYGKRGVGHRKAQKHSQAEVKPNAFSSQGTGSCRCQPPRRRRPQPSRPLAGTPGCCDTPPQYHACCTYARISEASSQTRRLQGRRGSLHMNHEGEAAPS